MSEDGMGYGVGWRRRLRLADLPAAVVACIGDADRKALGLPPRCPGKAGDGAVPPRLHGLGVTGAEGGKARKQRACAARGPNRTEARYRAERLRGVDARYEALTFRLGNGHRYTPDWVVFGGDGGIECHEVKGAYRFGSHGRARLAFDQARAEFPGFRWVWAMWSGGESGKWKVESEKPGEEVQA